MDEKENKNDEFSLEDIMKEFGEEVPQPEEDVRIWDREIPETPAAPQSFSDTVRLDDVSRALREMDKTEENMGDTLRFHLEETMRFSLGAEENEIFEEYMPRPPAETVEPFSDAWEPEYEQPIGDYVPMEPIPFRPRSRLHELKKKLVEGPERRYYELAEQGVGKLQIAIFLNVMVSLLCVGAVTVYAMGYIPQERLRLMVFFQFFGFLLSSLLGSYQLMQGFSDLLHRRFTLNTLLLFSFAACLADGIFCLKQLHMPCCGVFCLNVTMSLWSEYQKRCTEISQMDTMRKATRLDSIVAVPEGFEGTQVLTTGEGQVEDFMENYALAWPEEKVLSVYALVALFVSLATGILGGVLHGIGMGIHVFCASLLLAAPASSYVALSRPRMLLERRLHKHGAVLCGWKGVRALSKDSIYPLQDKDLFPVGTIKLNGVKFYGDWEPDDVVAYAAALICAGGGGLGPLFSQLLESRNGYRYTVDTLRGYPGGGIGGEINGEAVLAGSLGFMQAMGVDMPQGTRVSQAVYVAIDGSLSGVFAITYHKTKSAALGLTSLCAYRGLTPMLVGGDFMLTESFIRSKFGVNTRNMAFPNREIRQQLTQLEPDEQLPALALTTQEGLAGAAYAVAGARSLKTASTLGMIIHTLGGIIGLLMMLALAVVGAQELLNPQNLLIYELIWLVPGFLITEWTRSV